MPSTRIARRIQFEVGILVLVVVLACVGACGAIEKDRQCGDAQERLCGIDLGLCTAGIETCDDGQWGPCSGIAPAAEACDGADNDCDGDVDEGCGCRPPGSTRECGRALGLCLPGIQRCEDGEWGPCEDGPDHPYVAPAEEVCDGEDNDCDGDRDEGCDCQHGATRWCRAGDGVCEAGTQSCDDGSWGRCVPEQSAEPERCDGLDNDCDGIEDNQFLDAPCDSTGGCPRARVCAPDGLSSVCVEDARLFSAEWCDEIDNDCDGLVDRIVRNGSVESVCNCERRTLSIGDAADASIAGNVHLCEPTSCGPDRPRRLSVDGTCYAVCHAPSDPDGDGWGWEDGTSCLVQDSPRGRSAKPCGGAGIPLGMAMTYCLDCSGSEDLPYAMCQSVSQLDLSAFGRGEAWLRVEYALTTSGPAEVPINLWVHAGGFRRKHLPLVRVGDLPGNYEAVLRVEEACFIASSDFGPDCEGRGELCAHCGGGEVCGAVDACGNYDQSESWLQVAAEFCRYESGLHTGTVTLHQVELVEPNCAD